jgi:hypothetical protein
MRQCLWYGSWQDYLSDVTFKKVFGISKEEFKQLPKWKRDRKKKAAGLF